MLVNQNTFNLKSTIAEDWGNKSKIVVELEALTNAKDWKLGLSFPDHYKIDKIYGAELSTENGETYISGLERNKDLNKGRKTKVVLIVDEGKNGRNQTAILPKFSFADSIKESSSDNSKKSNSALTSESNIVEDWNGGYKLELDLKAESKVNNWQLDFSLPKSYNIREVYGVDLIDHGNGNYTIDGQDSWVNLQKGQSIKPILIIDDGGQQALLPEFDDSVTTTPSQESSPTPESKPASTPEPVEDSSPDTIDPVQSVESGAKATKQQGKFAYGEAIQKNFLFFEANRSGDLGPDNRVEWRSDSTLNDGGDVGRDLEGGYFDAGDHIKFVQPMTWSSTMLAWGGIDYQEAYKQSGQFDELLEAVKWGTDYFLKTHETNSSGQTERLWVQVGDKSDHSHWVAPEQIDKVSNRKSYYIDASKPGSDAAAGTASALASASMLFRGVDNAYADKLLKNAKALYDFAETHKGKYSDSVPQASPMYTSWSGYWDELAAGAAWLHKATGESKYLTKAENYFKNNLGGLGDWTYAADDHSYGAAMILATESSDPFFKGQVEKWLDTWVEGKGNVNYSPGGFAHRTPWASVPIAMSTAFAAEWYNDFIEPNKGFSEFATRQVDYVLGDNPKNYSYMIGFGDKYPLRPHHRGSHPVNGSAPTDIAQNILYGAIVGGPGAPDDYSHNDRRDDVKTNEVGTGYNAPFASAAIAQYNDLGGDAMSENELDQLIGIDANGVGF